MSGKDLKDKAIKIKQKDYVLVSDRVKYFNDEYPKGFITTELVSEPTSEMVVVKATVIPEIDTPDRKFTGYSQAVIGDSFINKVAALENAETSAVGRALGFMGIGVLDSVASADEMNKATTNNMKFATPKQIDWMRKEAQKVSGLDDAEGLDSWIEETLTVRPERVPIFKVKDAVAKIQSAEEKSVELDEVVEVTDEDIKQLEEGKLPY